MNAVAIHVVNVDLAPYLVNGDGSGLTDEEMAQVDAYLAEVKGDLVLSEETPSWDLCDITRLWWDCHIYTEFER